jgi:hypothetical protein
MSNRIALIVTLILLAAAVCVGGVRAASLSAPWNNGLCRNPNEHCWTYGHPVYTTIGFFSSSTTPTFGTSPQSGYSIARMLNDGPDMPALIARVRVPQHVHVTKVIAVLKTAAGRRGIHVSPRPLKHTLIWNLGPFTDGDVMLVRVYSHTSSAHAATFNPLQPQFFGQVLSSGLPDPSAMIFQDAQLAQ